MPAGFWKSTLLLASITGIQLLLLTFARRGLTVTYWRYWKLNAPPFTGEGSEPLFRGSTIEEALARIEFLVTNRRHVGSIVGPNGVGKSTLLRHCAQTPMTTLDMPNVRAIRISALGKGPGELLSIVSSELNGGRRVEQVSEAWTNLCDFFQAAIREDIHTVLLLDDTDSCTAACEDDLCRILSMSFPLTVLMAIEAGLMSTISRNLISRTELQVDLPAWEISQTAEFLAWNCARLGRHDPLFTDDAVHRIQQLSYGVPRRIVHITDLALVAGAVAKVNCIDAECVEQVAWELPKSNVA